MVKPIPTILHFTQNLKNVQYNLLQIMAYLKMLISPLKIKLLHFRFLRLCLVACRNHFTKYPRLH